MLCIYTLIERQILERETYSVFNAMVLSLLIRICLLISISLTERTVQYSGNAIFQRNKQNYLPNHALGTEQAKNELECALFCARHTSCTSINYKTSGVGKGLCELNNQHVQEMPEGEHKTYNLAEFTHLKIIKKVTE